jgi:hypothetical protein
MRVLLLGLLILTSAYSFAEDGAFQKWNKEFESFYGIRVTQYLESKGYKTDQKDIDKLSPFKYLFMNNPSLVLKQCLENVDFVKALESGKPDKKNKDCQSYVTVLDKYLKDYEVNSDLVYKKITKVNSEKLAILDKAIKEKPFAYTPIDKLKDQMKENQNMRLDYNNDTFDYLFGNNYKHAEIKRAFLRDVANLPGAGNTTFNAYCVMAEQYSLTKQALSQKVNPKTKKMLDEKCDKSKLVVDKSNKVVDGFIAEYNKNGVIIEDRYEFEQDLSKKAGILDTPEVVVEQPVTNEAVPEQKTDEPLNPDHKIEMATDVVIEKQ